MYHVSAQGIDERMINVHYYHYYDVVIADTGDQALDIFLHGPESTHKNGIGKTFTHTSIPIHQCTLLKQRAKSSTH